MRNLNKLFLLILFSLFIQVSAQTLPADPKNFKFGKVDPAEFNIKPTGADSAAAAIKIFDIGTGHFDVSNNGGSLVYVFERRVRYKIMNKNGYDLADLEIPLYRNNKGSEEKLIVLYGASYNLTNNNIIVSKLSNDAKFSSRQDKNHIIKKFTLPNVKEGSIIEYSYKTASDFIFQLDDWRFQSYYPCKYSSFTITIPQYYIYKTSAGGYINVTQDKPIQVSQMLYIPSDGQHSAYSVDAQAMKIHYHAENVPAIKSENYITTLDDYVSKVGFELNTIQYPNSEPKEFNSTWPKIMTEMMSNEHFGEFLKNKNYDDQLANGIIKGEKDPELQMNMILNYVKNTIKWNGKYNDYAEASSQKAILENKSGNSGEVNLILLELLKDAGLESYPVLLSTRNNGTHPGYPLLSKFNNLIVLVKIGDKTHLLDATDKNNLSDLISYQNLNHKGLKLNLDANDAEWISLENSKTSSSNTVYSIVLNTVNKITGNLFLSSSNYSGLDRRSNYLSANNQQEYITKYKSSKPGLNINNYTITNLNEPEKPLVESMDITIEDNVEEAGNLVYFSPLLFERTKENPFTLEERNFPVDFAHPFEENCRMVLDFPENYQLDKLPKSEKFRLPNDGGSFTITYAAEGNKIAVISRISILKSVFTADEYYNLKELYKNIIRKQSEQIVFRKS